MQCQNTFSSSTLLRSICVIIWFYLFQFISVESIVHAPIELLFSIFIGYMFIYLWCDFLGYMFIYMWWCDFLTQVFHLFDVTIFFIDYLNGVVYLWSFVIATRNSIRLHLNISCSWWLFDLVCEFSFIEGIGIIIIL